MRILQVTPSLAVSDAVSTDLLIAKARFQQRGIEAGIFAEEAEPGCRKECLSRIELEQQLAAADTVLIYHHSIYWKMGTNILRKAKGTVLVKYHNITPPLYFYGYDDQTGLLVEKGIRQTRDIVQLGAAHRYLACSKFSGKDLTALGVAPSQLAIVPPFHQVDQLRHIATKANLSQELSASPNLKVFYVGRIFPHKGIHHLLGTVLEYKIRYGGAITLNIAGSIRHDSHYIDDLRDYIKAKGISDQVHLLGKVSAEELKTYLSCSDALLFMSEHEGFGVPILEAQSLGLPIVALARGATKEIIGADQVVFDDVDYGAFASALKIIRDNREHRDFLIQRGYDNTARFSNDATMAATVAATEAAVAAAGAAGAAGPKGPLG